jgi:hypothetical protein
MSAALRGRDCLQASRCALSILLVLTELQPCIAGRARAPSSRNRMAFSGMRVHVTRQAEATDEDGKSFAKVFVWGDNLSQEQLDSRVVAGVFPELVFTDSPQKQLFETWKTKDIPVELHVDSQGEFASAAPAGAPSCNSRERLAAPGETVAASAVDTYTDSYGHITIHELMLRDQPRCTWYKSELDRACKEIKNAVVLDVGSGTGLLSMFAARAGAKKVYAVEANERIAKLSALVVADNGLESVITVIHGKLEDIDLPEQVHLVTFKCNCSRIAMVREFTVRFLHGKLDVDLLEQVDILVSEWMGFYLLHESMLASGGNSQKSASYEIYCMN